MPDSSSPAVACRVVRLTTGEEALAARLFTVMAEVFGEERQAPGAAYLARLLGRDDFWALAALAGDEVIGGLTAHTLPMTRSESSEVFLYDLAVQPRYQRRGVGRGLVDRLRQLASEAGIEDVFVPADSEDQHALDFYRAIGGQASPVTFFTFATPARGG